MKHLVSSLLGMKDVKKSEEKHNKLHTTHPVNYYNQSPIKHLVRSLLGNDFDVVKRTSTALLFAEGKVHREPEKSRRHRLYAEGSCCRFPRIIMPRAVCRGLLSAYMYADINQFFAEGFWPSTYGSIPIVIPGMFSLCCSSTATAIVKHVQRFRYRLEE